MAFISILFALLAMVLWGFEELFLKKTIARVKTLTTLLINTITGVILQFLVVVVLIGKITLIPINDFLLVIVAVITAFLGYLFFYKALGKQKLSLISSLDNSWIIVSIIIAMVFFGEKLNFISTLSVVLVLFGAFLISANFKKLKRMRFILGGGYELLSVIFIGITVPLEKVIVNRIGEANTIIYLGVLILPSIFIYKFFMKEKFIKPNKKALKTGIASGIFDGLAFIFYLLALKSTNVSIVAPIVASSVIVSVFLGRVYLKEKMTLKQIIGAIAILIGVIILSITFNLQPSF
ncbi:MAG: EamA family transporter [Nanoarchaeota archaeon]